jgi:hypothetical protein
MFAGQAVQFLSHFKRSVTTEESVLTAYHFSWDTAGTEETGCQNMVTLRKISQLPETEVIMTPFTYSANTICI